MPGGLAVTGDENHLIQILINLVQNSMSAVKGRPDPHIWVAAYSTPDRVIITVTDNGCGIEPQNLPQIFDPFFTTKDVGEGMGMGLNICYRMMKQMNGGIDVESEVNSFTQFTLWLPKDATQQEVSKS